MSHRQSDLLLPAIGERRHSINIATLSTIHYALLLESAALSISSASFSADIAASI
jgi:hypothetical protein